MYISRSELMIDGVQYVPGQVMDKPYGGLAADGGGTYCRPLAEGEELVGCEDCEARFNSGEALRYHRRLVHGAEPSHPDKGRWYRGIATKPY